MYMKLCMYLTKLLERKEGREGGQETGRKQVHETKVTHF